MTERGWAEGNIFRNLYDLLIVPISGGQPRVLAENIKSLATLFETVSWSPDSKQLSYTNLREQGSKGDCYIVSINGGPPRKATQDPHPSFGGAFRAPLWDANAESVYLIAGNALWRISLQLPTFVPHSSRNFAVGFRWCWQLALLPPTCDAPHPLQISAASVERCLTPPPSYYPGQHKNSCRNL